MNRGPAGRGAKVSQEVDLLTVECYGHPLTTLPHSGREKNEGGEDKKNDKDYFHLTGFRVKLYLSKLGKGSFKGMAIVRNIDGAKKKEKRSDIQRPISKQQQLIM